MYTQDDISSSTRGGMKHETQTFNDTCTELGLNIQDNHIVMTGNTSLFE